MAIRLASSFPNVTVLATCGTRSVARCKALGAHVVIDYQVSVIASGTHSVALRDTLASQRESLEKALADANRSVDIVYETANAGHYDMIVDKFRPACYVGVDTGKAMGQFVKDLVVRKVRGGPFKFLGMVMEKHDMQLRDRMLAEDRIPKLETTVFPHAEIVDALG